MCCSEIRTEPSQNMPVRKKDAQRALLLLEEYRNKLNHTEDRQLRRSIQRVIDIFQSNLFQALIGSPDLGITAVFQLLGRSQSLQNRICSCWFCL
ncbi:hypothetical protein CHARACLAT_020448 [Characodon lateralis]|uniref:L27-1 domain-containing protein n=1 Tax=Characodon lateralis TaxID=208331 RepID=A0ABU7EEK0_9TELE|nr:hypothetical protein [Characodon lateralis]